MSGLILKSLTKSFASHKVLEDISLELASGELLVLLGSSGSGKSTLLRLIAGLEKPDSGEIYINDRRVDNLPPKERKVAMVFQNYSLYPHMTVEKNLSFPLKVAGEKRNEIKKKVVDIARMLKLSEKLKVRPGQLSGGQRQRVALGRAIIRKPSLFLLDEPLSNLDANLRMKMRREIVRLQKDLGITTVHVTHDQIEALTMADRIALLSGGKLLQTGTPQELYGDPQSLPVAEFIGFPKINIVGVKIEDNQLIPFGFNASRFKLKYGGDGLMVGIRPEAIEISGQGKFKAQVTECEYLGEQYIVKMQFKDTELISSGRKKPLSVGQSVLFDLSEKELLFFDSHTGLRIDFPQ
ncbi:MAG: ABC transporter ATP-binding protein [FCB group bacterium]|nr:ABC transporter ATP-binding protein [FCB group bacterium]